MKQYRYVKSNAFTSGKSLGNPAACIFTGQAELSPEQMQAIAAEHKGFVMEVVFCSQSDVADCKLTYYSSECEVEFCGHGTIATMYTMVKETPELMAKPVITAETNRKGIIEVFNAINKEDAVYITAPDPIEYPMNLSVEQIEDALTLSHGSIRKDLPMRTTVAGTILEKAGTLSDALSKIPSLEAERDGGVKVLGRGDAEVYINGRKVLDMKELSRLRSDQIQHVDVVQNPGARYAASVKAVVRITLKKAQGEGLSFQNSTQFMYQYGGSLNDNSTANYRTGGLDVTGSFWVGTYNHYKGLQVNDMLYYVGPNQVTGHSTQEIRHPWHAWSPQLQLNYMVNENHTFGAYYKYDRTPSGETKGDYLTDMFENGILTEHSASYIWQDQSVKKHIFNAYYNGKVGQLGIDLNIDGLFDDTKTPGRTTEKTTAVSAAPVDRTIESNTNSANNFWESKIGRASCRERV